MAIASGIGRLEEIQLPVIPQLQDGWMQRPGHKAESVAQIALNQNAPIPEPRAMPVAGQPEIMGEAPVVVPTR
jgi:hypothetical protein